MKSLLLILFFALQSFAVTSGSYTVGSGGDYANWAAAAAATGNLTGNLTFMQISNVTDNTALAFNVALGGYTLTLTSNKSHKGNFQGGWLTTFSMNLSANSNAVGFTCTSSNSGATITISNLNIKYTGTATIIGRIIGLANNTSNITTNINNVLINANSKAVACVRGDAANLVLKMFNCVLVNGTAGTGQYSAGFNVGQGILSSSVISNVTCHNFSATSTGISGGFVNYVDSAYTLKNCASLGNYKDYLHGTSFTTGFGNTTATKCASSDTSGNVGFRSLSATDQFQSVTITDGDTYLKIKSTGILKDSGVAPSIAANTTGIRGTARPHNTSYYSIGADEFKSTHPSVVITADVDTFSDNTPFTATITFSEDVTGLDSSEVTATNCTKTDFSGSGSVYTYTITPTGTGDIVISAPENIAVDLYANGNTAATDKTITYVASSVATGKVKQPFKN